MAWNSGDLPSSPIRSDRSSLKRLRRVKRFSWWNAIRTAWKRFAAVGPFCATAVSTLTRLFSNGGWTECLNKGVWINVAHAGRVGAARSYLAGVAARAHGLAGKICADSLGVWRHRQEACAR